MTNRDLVDLLAILADRRVLKYKTADIELEISPLAFVAIGGPQVPETEALGMANGGIPTDEELLFMSSEGLPSPGEKNDKPS